MTRIQQSKVGGQLGAIRPAGGAVRGYQASCGEGGQLDVVLVPARFPRYLNSD